MIRMTQRICVTGALLILATLAYADGRNYNDGPVVNVSAIKTVDGHFDDYMQWLATTWKKQEEAAKKAGLITKYQVLVVQPQGPNDPDIYLVVEYKNWAAFDGLGKVEPRVQPNAGDHISVAEREPPGTKTVDR